MKIRPAFDPETCTWFYGNVEAPTVRELLQKLPRGTRVESYYPNGAPPTDWGPFSERAERVVLPKGLPKLTRPRKPRKAAPPKPPKPPKPPRKKLEGKVPRRPAKRIVGLTPDQIEQLKALVAQGTSYQVIGSMIGKTRSAVAGYVKRIREIDSEKGRA